MAVLIKLLVISVGIQLCILIMGKVIECVIRYLMKLSYRFIGKSLTNLIFNYITFIGVIHHEVSHILFAVVTGAKVRNVKLFKVVSQTNSLGSVSIITKGPRILRDLQSGLVAIAPMITGIISIYIGLRSLTGKTSLVEEISILYIVLSIFIHMMLSDADIKAYKNSCISITIIIWIILYLVYMVEIKYNILI